MPYPVVSCEHPVKINIQCAIIRQLHILYSSLDNVFQHCELRLLFTMKSNRGIRNSAQVRRKKIGSARLIYRCHMTNLTMVASAAIDVCAVFVALLNKDYIFCVLMIWIDWYEALWMKSIYFSPAPSEDERITLKNGCWRFR